MIHIKARNAPEAYVEALTMMRLHGKEYPSRNGDVIALAEPALLEITNPLERVLFDPIRQANPYFHVMEFIWMIAGANDVGWLEQFNARYRAYAEDDGKVHGAYGYRWTSHFRNNQLLSIHAMLRDDPSTRRAVLGMWDPRVDLQSKRDLPCNTHIYFRVLDEKLEMTVCNRSNDLIWGMLGANVVHMTMLQELLAQALKRECGPYRVFTNNLHMYKSIPKFESIWETTLVHDPYRDLAIGHRLLGDGELLEKFLWDARDFMARGVERKYACSWFNDVAKPMFAEYMWRKSGMKRPESYVKLIQDDAWKEACRLWEEWHEKE